MAEVDTAYQIVRSFSLIAVVGYEKLVFPGVTGTNLTGPIWSGGFEYTPTPDTLVRLVYGRRDGGNDFSGEFRFAVTPATKVYATYTQQVETTQQAIIAGLGNAGQGPGGTLINPVTGLPVSVVNPNFPLVNDIFREKSLQGGLISAVGRNTFTVTGFHVERTSLTGLTPSDTSYGGSVEWSRDINPKTTGSMLIGYARDTIGSGATINASVGVSHIFNETLVGGIRYDYIRGGGGLLGVGAGGGVGTTGNSFTQNALTLSLRKTF